MQELMNGVGKVYLRHHWSAWTGDWYYGVCDSCGWSGRELRDPEKARYWMNHHSFKCKGKKMCGFYKNNDESTKLRCLMEKNHWGFCNYMQVF